MRFLGTLRALCLLIATGVWAVPKLDIWNKLLLLNIEINCFWFWPILSSFVNIWVIFYHHYSYLNARRKFFYELSYQACYIAPVLGDKNGLNGLNIEINCFWFWPILSNFVNIWVTFYHHYSYLNARKKFNWKLNTIATWGCNLNSLEV